MYGFIGWFVGTLLRFVYPYVKLGLETVAETNDWKSWPAFQWKYLILFLISAAELGIALLIFEGMIETISMWSLFVGAAVGYAGTELGKDTLDIGAAVRGIVT